MRNSHTKLRKARAVIALTLLPLSACDAASEWFAGIDPQNDTWDPPLGAAPAAGAMEKDLKACMGEPGTPSAEAAKGEPTITRPEDSEAVAACMETKGWTKVYQTRQTLF